MDTLVSIIMPVYNVEKYIAKSIQSILNQVYSNFELIIVIDGSPDDSADIAEKFSLKDSRIKVLYKENGGLSDARNYGMRYAKGKYIYFIDSDDSVEANLLDEAVCYIEENNLDLVVFGFYTDFEDENQCINKSIENKAINGIYNTENFQYIPIDDKFYNYIGYAWNKLYRLSVIQDNEIEFKKGLSLIEDIDFNYNVLININSIGFIDKCLYHYIQRPRTTLVNSKYENFYDLKLDAAKLRIQILNDWKLNEKIISEESSKLYLGALNSGLSNICTCKGLKFKEKKYKIRKILNINKSLNYDNRIINKLSKKEIILIILEKLGSAFLINLMYNLNLKFRREI